MKKLCCVVLCCVSRAQRIGNYVANGSFEKYTGCPLYVIPKNWAGIDSTCSWGLGIAPCNSQFAGNFQYPHSGQVYLGTTFYYISLINPLNERSYPRNRLKATLQAGRIYCVKFYVNIRNGSTYGMDGFGTYFCDNSIDTINYCTIPLSYITPQVQNPQGNIITDTLNWIPITGTFVANGTEKYLLIGNFLSNEDTDTLLINPTHLPNIGTDVCIDDVSCIPIDLEAYAGRDTTIYLNDSTYIGREKDFAIDSGCVWYKLPSTTAIDTISGMWVKPPIGTHTYVVRQELECSSLKWDTVVVTVREFDVGIEELEIKNFKLEIYPNPTNGNISLTLNPSPVKRDLAVSVYDVLGKVILSQKIEMKNGKGEVDVSGLENGIYFIHIKTEKNGSATKKLIISK